MLGRSAKIMPPLKLITLKSLTKVLLICSLFISISCKNELDNGNLNDEIINIESEHNKERYSTISNRTSDNYTISSIKINNGKHAYFNYPDKDQEFFSFGDEAGNTKCWLSFYGKTRLLTIYEIKGSKERLEKIYLYQEGIGFVEQNIKKGLNENLTKLLKEDGYSDKVLKGHWEDIPQ